MNAAEILREAAYEEGYKAGKVCAAQQILDDLDEILTEKQEQYNQKKKERPDIDYPEADSYWLGRSVTCGEILRLLEQLKNKYEVN